MELLFFFLLRVMPSYLRILAVLDLLTVILNFVRRKSLKLGTEVKVCLEVISFMIYLS